MWPEQKRGVWGGGDPIEGKTKTAGWRHIMQTPESYVHFTMQPSSLGINDKTPRKSLIKCNRTAKDDVLRGSWGGTESESY